MDNKKKQSTILKPVFYPSVAIIALLVIFAMAMPQVAGETFSSMKQFISDRFGWLYMLSVGIFTLFVIFLAVSPFGRFKLGPDQSKPSYSHLSWFAMLFSAGMGIGLMFWGVAEPVCTMGHHLLVKKIQLKLLNKLCELLFFTGDYMLGQFMLL